MFVWCVVAGDCAEGDGGGGCYQHQAGQKWNQVTLLAVVFSSCCLTPSQHHCGMMLTASPPPLPSYRHHRLKQLVVWVFFFFTGIFQTTIGCSAPVEGHRWRGKFYHCRSKPGLDLVICFPPSALVVFDTRHSLAYVSLWRRTKPRSWISLTDLFLFSLLYWLDGVFKVSEFAQDF